jgi:DNA-binding transcriptional LysR family regulator
MPQMFQLSKLSGLTHSSALKYGLMSSCKRSSLRLPTIVVRKDVSEGKLVDFLPEWAPRTATIHAVFPSRRGLLPSVRAFPDFLAFEYSALSRAEKQEGR